jgi:acetyl-CoA synthetase
MSRATHPLEQPENRIVALAAEYADSRACAAHLLCDRHDPVAVAYTIVASDLSSRDLSYGALREESERLAAALTSLGLGAGDRIATLMGKSRAYLVTVMAIWRLGAVHVPLFTAFAAPAITTRLLASGCKLVVCDAVQRAKLTASDGIQPWRVVTTGAADDNVLSFDSLLAKVRPGFVAAALGGNAPIIQIYTSGTTGTPKGVVVPLRAVAGFRVYAEYGLGLQADDVFWNAADPGWAYGLYFGILAALSTGVRGILLEGGFSAETTGAVLSRYGVTNFTAAPTVYRSLRAGGMSPSAGLKLRCASSAGEPLTPEVNEWATAALGVPVHDHYGQTEAGMLINNHHHPQLRRALRARSMGHALPGWKAVVLQPDADEPVAPGQPGRVAMDLRESPLAWFEGYIGDTTKSAEKFTQNGRWYLTGDTGYVDHDGYFYFSGRDDDVIIMAGYRIGPADVESVLLAHAAVAECAVVAAPDAIRGEVLDAVVVLRSGQAPSEELTLQLQEWVKRRYAAHAYPRHIHYLDSLPKTPSGKVQRFVLRRQLRKD